MDDAEHDRQIALLKRAHSREREALERIIRAIDVERIIRALEKQNETLQKVIHSRKPE